MSTETPRPASAADRDSASLGQQLLAAFDAVADVPPAQREAAIQALGLECRELERELRALLDRDAETGPLDASLSGQIRPLLREALPELDPAPAQIGPYAVLRLLGEGGMGRVYLARRSDGPVAREVAIKLIRPDRAGAGLLARFEAERRHLAALDHPGICRFIDADSLADGTPYVVMEAVEGEPIIDYCQRHSLGLRARVELLRKLLAAVAHAHDRLLLHRDIKPHNVLVTAEGQPKLLDFGIAKSIEDAQASVTRTAERFFTPNASPPEQLLGQPAGVASDVYSLGALAYELLSGALPFEFKDLRAAEIERLILQVAPPLMSERSAHAWARELRGDLDAIIATCLRKAPSERYRNVDALDAELQRWLEGRPVTARAPSWAYRSRLFVRRHRTAVALSTALGLAIGLLGSALLQQVRQASDTARLLQDMFLSAEAEGVSAYSMDLAGFFSRATARAIDDQTQNPSKRIELLQILSTRSTELNDIDSAERAARAALETASAYFGKTSAEYAHAADRLARTMIYGRGSQAVEEARELLLESTDAHRRGSPSLGHLIIHYRAKALLGQYTNDHAMMVDSYRRIVELLEADPKVSPQLLLTTKSDFGNVLSVAGRQSEAMQEADSALEEVEALLSQTPSGNIKELWRVVAITACEHRVRQSSDSAIPLCEEILADLRESNNLVSRAGVDAYFWLGTALTSRGELEEALDAFRTAQDSLSKIQGTVSDSLDVHRINRGIGRALTKSGRHNDAVPYYDEALAFFESRNSPSTPHVLTLRLDLLESLSKSGQLKPDHPKLAQDFDPANLLPNDQPRWQEILQKYVEENSR